MLAGVTTVVLAEDDSAIAEPLSRALQREGYDVRVVGDGLAALEHVQGTPVDLLVLDLGLPGMDGLEVCRRIRADNQADLPVLMLTARTDEVDFVVGLDAGADDYVAKPFRIEEVLARTRALIRRAHGHAAPELRCGRLTLDPRLAVVTLDGAPVTLTGHEYRTLAYLMHQQGRVVSRGELTEHIYAQNFERDSNTVEVFVARLRRKLGPALIETVRGLGYRMGAARTASDRPA
jgi:two-component system OmpR family response regulator